jgi:DNA-directed RNA polymerase specialized sigma24 family protein
MRATEAYVEGEQNLEVRIRGKGTREMQDVLSRCRPSFYRTAYRQLNNAADAEDAVQDALLSAYKHLDQFKGQAQMSTWLTTIIMNCARMQLRRRSRQSLLSLDEQFGEESDLCLLEDWLTIAQAPKSSVKGPNCAGISCNSLSSFRPACARHSSCVNWTA